MNSAAERWNQMARSNAMRYIAGRIEPADFWTSGERVFCSHLLPAIQRMECPRTLAVEIGCGIGRLLVPVSRHFERVIGVDHSVEMLRRGRALCGQRNIVFSDGVPDGPISFVYSYLCFQHIEDILEIRRYLLEVSERLEAGGIAYFQFDTRPGNVPYEIRNGLPDAFLPRKWRHGMRRIRRPASLVRELCAGRFRILKETGAGTAEHWFVLAR